LGGLPVLLGYLSGIFVYVAVLRFYLNLRGKIPQKYCSNSHYCNYTLFGCLDDLTALFGRKKIGGKIHSGEKKSALSQSTKFLLPVFAAVPLMVVNSGVSIINIRFFGNVDIGIFYSLFVVP